MFDHFEHAIGGELNWVANCIDYVEAVCTWYVLLNVDSTEDLYQILDSCGVPADALSRFMTSLEEENSTTRRETTICKSLNLWTTIWNDAVYLSLLLI